MIRGIKNVKGNAIIWSLITVSILFVISSSAAIIFIGDLRQTYQIDDSARAYMAAEAGYERAIFYAKKGQTYQESVSRFDDGEGEKISTSPSNNSRYYFQVVENSDPEIVMYDYPQRECQSDAAGNIKSFCFVSKGISGNAVRKIDGYLVDINSADKPYVFTGFGEGEPYASGLASFPGETTRGKSLDFSSSDFFGTGSDFPIIQAGKTPKVFVYKGRLSLSNDYNITGLYEGETSGNNKGFGFYAWDDTKNYKFTPFIYQNSYTTNSTSIAEAAFSIPKTSNLSYNYTITYRKGGSKNAHTVTIQVNGDDKKCYGISTFYYSGDINSFKAFFLSFAPNSTGVTNERISLSSGGSFDNLSLMVYY